MTEKAAAQASPTSLQLHSAREMRQPDKDGQLPHLFMTLSSDIPINELTLDDILEVNWNGVKTSIQDALVRVRHEGDLTSATVRDTIRLVAFVLKKLGSAGADLERRIERHPSLGFWGWLVSLSPTATGGKLRGISRDRRRMKRQRKELDAHHDEIFEMRVEMAQEIDKKLDMVLASTDPAYHELLVRLQSGQAERTTARSILTELERLSTLESKLADMYSTDTRVSVTRRKITQINDKLRSFVDFCQRHGGEHVEDRNDAELFVREMLARLDAQAAPIEQVMAAKREAMKQELYAEASTP